MGWWLAAAGALLGYLSLQPPPTAWDYKQWLAASLAGVGWLSGYLKASPLPLSYQAQEKMNAGEGFRGIPAPPAQTPPPAPKE
jgi:hypothetical protein